LVKWRLEVLVISVHLIVLAAGRDPFPAVDAQTHEQPIVYMTAATTSRTIRGGGVSTTVTRQQPRNKKAM
jgi:hypothetical protein